MISLKKWLTHFFLKIIKGEICMIKNFSENRRYLPHFWSDQGFNPIPAGVLENQDMLGGVNLTPPSKSKFLSKYDKWYIIRKLLCSTFRICKKICKFAKIEFFIAKSSFIVKMFAKKNLSKKWQIIHFWKALDHAISNMQKFLQNFK